MSARLRELNWQTSDKKPNILEKKIFACHIFNMVQNKLVLEKSKSTRKASSVKAQHIGANHVVVSTILNICIIRYFLVPIFLGCHHSDANIEKD